MSKYIDSKWNRFIKELPHHVEPYSKKNWGNPNHSLCSYQGKLKPAIAHYLVKTFVPQGGTLFDPFCGVGTIPFEGALQGRLSYGMDISPLAYYVASAKLSNLDHRLCIECFNKLRDYLDTREVPEQYRRLNGQFGFNKSLAEYYEPVTFNEILKARLYFTDNPPRTPEEMMVISCLLHILHGNRPYSLSRRSHPIVPYAPTGLYEYKSVIGKLEAKMDKALRVEYPRSFIPGTVFLQDSTMSWPDEINELDAIITSPPFFDSTRFYLANWIRLWFTGWETKDFHIQPENYVDERQKVSFDVYDPIFELARERIKNGGYFVMHLGKSNKCDMGAVLQQKALHWFNKAKVYSESVAECDTFGIKDIGTVTDHEYLVIQ